MDLEKFWLCTVWKSLHKNKKTEKNRRSSFKAFVVYVCMKNNRCSVVVFIQDCMSVMSRFQMGMGATRMGQPNAAQLQNQYLPPGQFPGSSPGRGSGPVGMNQPGAQSAVPPVRTE